MKRLVLMRHGKSNWSADEWSLGADGDHERPLAPRGEKAARTMGRVLSTIGWRPDAVVASTAVRARTTAELAREGGGFEGAPFTLEPSLYEAPVSAVLDVARSLDDGVETLLVVGHEPTSSSAVAALCGGGSVRMVTAAVAGIELAVDRWAEVREGRGSLLFVLPPRSLGALLDA